MTLDGEVHAAAYAASLDVMDVGAIQIEEGGQSFWHEFEEDSEHKISGSEIFVGEVFLYAIRIDAMRMPDRSVNR